MDFLVLCPPGGIYVQEHIGKRFAITETTWLRLKVFSKSGIGCSRLNPDYLGTLMLNLRFTEVGVRRSLILVRLALIFFPRTLRGIISSVLFMVLSVIDICVICTCVGIPMLPRPAFLLSCLLSPPLSLFYWLLSYFLLSTSIT